MDTIKIGIYNAVPLIPQHLDALQKLFDANEYIFRDAGLGNMKNAHELFSNPRLPKNGKIENNVRYCIFSRFDELVAYIDYYLFFRDQPVVYIGDFYVDRKYHRKGIGTQILREFETLWKQATLDHAILNVFLTNFIALNFWIAQGFTTIKGTIPASAENIHDAMIRLEKAL